MGMRKTLGDGGCIHFLDCEDAFINVYISLTHLIAHLNVQFTVSQLYLNKAIKKE